MMGPAAFLTLILAAAPAQAAAEDDSAHRLIFLAETRPIFLRLRVTSRGRPFEASWIDSIKALHASLDRNGDGTVTTKEADPKVLAALVRIAAGAVEQPDFEALDAHPKDGKISIEELAESLRPILGPFRLQVGRQPVGRTDALFDQLDRDKDGALTKPELGAIAGSLRPLDLDDNEMIGAEEIESFNGPAITALMMGPADTPARSTGSATVVELLAGESTFKPARLLLTKYDKGKPDMPGRPDGKLSPDEFAIAPDAFAAVDKNGDDALDMDELRKLLAGRRSTSRSR